MLKKLRVIISLIIFSLLTFFFLDFAGILPPQIHILGQIQFIPAWLSRNVLAMIFLLVCALLFGRVYCSFICPMGIFQNIVCKKKGYKYRKNNPIAIGKPKLKRTRLRPKIDQRNMGLFFLYPYFFFLHTIS